MTSTSTIAAGDWPAPVAQGPVVATVSLPGSKSLTNRLLVLAALAGDVSLVRRPLRSRDTLLMTAALRALGTVIEDRPGSGPDGDDWLVTPAPLRGPATVDAGLAGTVMRFVPPVATLAVGEVRFDGDPHARSRPMQPVLGALRTLGADLHDDGRGGLPFVVRGSGRLRGGAVTLDASASSQFVSGLLLSGARFDQGLTVRHDGKPIPSEPHIAMTVEVLRDAGVDVDDSEPDTWRVAPCQIRAVDVQVEPDLSNAAPFLAAAVVTGGTVRVPGWPPATTQAGDAVREIFAAMGAEVALDRSGLTVSGPARADGVDGNHGVDDRHGSHGSRAIEGIDVDLHDVGELTPVVAAVAALAGSPTWIRGVAHLRGHETDRLHALTSEIGGLGGDVTETDDGLRIRPRPLHGGLFRTYGDHRMAMAGSVLGLRVPGVVVQDVATTAKTMPDYPERWALMLRGGSR